MSNVFLYQKKREEDAGDIANGGMFLQTGDRQSHLEIKSKFVTSKLIKK